MIHLREGLSNLTRRRSEWIRRDGVGSVRMEDGSRAILNAAGVQWKSGACSHGLTTKIRIPLCTDDISCLGENRRITRWNSDR